MPILGFQRHFQLHGNLPTTWIMPCPDGWGSLVALTKVNKKFELMLMRCTKAYIAVPVQ